MKTLMMSLFLLIAIYAYADIFSNPQDIVNHLKDYQDELITFDQKEVDKIKATKNQSLEDEGRKKLLEDVKDEDSNAGISMRFPTLNDEASVKNAEKDIEHFKNMEVPDVEDLRHYLNTDEKNDPNIGQAMSSIYIASEIVKDSKNQINTNIEKCEKVYEENYFDDPEWLIGWSWKCTNHQATENDLALLEERIKNAGIFAGNRLSCTNYVNWYRPKAQKCNVRVSVKTSYECSGNGNLYNNYNSCSRSCDSVCKKNTDYNKPSLEWFNFDITNITGVTNGEKRLAVARKLNECYSDGSRAIKKKFGWFVKKTVGREHYHCCFANPMVKDLNLVIRDQLRSKGLPSGYACQTGIPLSMLKHINFDDPRLSDVMRRQITNVFDGNMSADFSRKFENAPKDNSEAKKFEQNMQSELNKKRIPGF